MNRTDLLLQSLIKKTIHDENRSEKYIKALPKMNAEEKLRMLTQLLEYSALQLEQKYEDKIEEKFLEIYENKDDDFGPETFAAVADQLIAEFANDREEMSLSEMDEADKQDARTKAQAIADKLKELADEVNTLVHHEE